MTEPRDWWKGPQVLGVVVPLVVFLAQASWLWHFSIDDAAISWRYSAHLASGEGLRWNLEGPPVEGYSNFLWVLMLALMGRVGFEIEAASKILGLAFGLASFALLALLCRRLWKENRFWWTPLLFLAVTPEWAMWTMSGLELASFAAFVLLAIVALSDPQRINRVTLSVALTGVVLSRPEGIGVCLLLLAVAVMLPRSDSSRKDRLQEMTWPALTTVAVAVGLVLFRLSYFGYPMPNTVYAKFSLECPSLPAVLRWLLLGVPFLVAWGLALWKPETPRNRWTLAIALLILLGHTAMTLPVSSVMNFDHRYHIPFMALLVLAAPCLLDILWNRRRVTALVALAVMAIWPLKGFPAVHLRRFWESQRIVSQRCIAENLRTLPGRPTVALQDAGRIPYWCDLPYIDAWGLCDVEFARQGFSPENLLARRPNLIVLSADSLVNGLVHPRLGLDKILYRVKAFPVQYRLWRHCVFANRKRTDAYDYAIVADVFWAMDNNLEIPGLQQSGQ
jgi:hypothetical protein